jgi:hypothetical protein
MMEKQRVVIDELKTKLDLNMDDFNKLRYNVGLGCRGSQVLFHKAYFIVFKIMLYSM